jgi:cytosine/adenosine deaminase-related metal-dependent hydrolase|tara:strand:+ start:63 stop:1232 length:1170 start_codon:yes stop_codon:yes gene_type:complete
MKKISADYIYPGNTTPIKNGVIVYDTDGKITELLNPIETEINWDDVERFNGIICPGFVNTHCHLEFSYLKGKIAEETQLHGFVKDIISLRENFSDKERLDAISLAEQEMIKNGIVAVGDISNGSSTFEHKEKSQLNYHTFIEVFGSNPKIAEAAFKHAESVYNSYFDKERASITPHATYSVSDNLVKLINVHAVANNSLISIHNQETASENAFFKEGNGAMFDFLNIANKTNNQFVPTGKNALPSFLSKYKNLNKTLLVHNTFTEKKDVLWAQNYADNIFWCFCPNANEYIEGKQPDYSLFKDERCTVGTDSLASNWSLSILDELKTITTRDSSIPLTTLIKWATFNGAQFLGFEKLGSIEKKKTPGLNLITNIVSQKLNANSIIKKII